MLVPATLLNWKNRFRLRLDRLVEQRWINVGLRAKMGAIVVVGLVGLLTIFALLGISTTRQATQQVLSERVMLARLSATNLDSTFRHIQSLMAIVADQEALRNPQAGPTEREAALRAGFRQIAIFSQGIHLLDAGGRPLASATETPWDVDWAEVAAVQEVLSGKPFSLSVVPGDQPYAAIAVPVFDEDATPIGCLVAQLDLTDPDISPFEQPFDLGQRGTLDVVDATGTVLMSTDPHRLLIRSNQDALLNQLFVAGEPTVETCVGCYQGEQSELTDRVIAFAPMLQAPWGVVVQQDSGEVFAPVRRLTRQTAILGMAAVVGALGLVWVTTNSVINPLQLLMDAAQRIADGDLTTPICCLRGDEIGALANSFDAMRAQLKNSIEEIQAWNRELDARVRERTQAALAAQQEAQRAHDDLRAIIDGLSDELIVIGLDYQVQQVNRAAQQRRTDNGKIIGRPCYQVFHNGHPCRPPECECPVPIVLSTGQSVKVTHTHRDPQSGQERYMDIVASPMRDSTGRITRIIELMRDVTGEANRRIAHSA